MRLRSARAASLPCLRARTRAVSGEPAARGQRPGSFQGVKRCVSGRARALVHVEVDHVAQLHDDAPVRPRQRVGGRLRRRRGAHERTQ
jgi:hypothetical protein